MRKLVVVTMLAVVCAGQPATVPGDVLFIDPSTSQPYIWIHAASGRMELLSPYTDEQAFRLLLNREQSVWDILTQYQRGVAVAGCPTGAAR